MLANGVPAPIGRTSAAQPQTRETVTPLRLGARVETNAAAHVPNADGLEPVADAHRR
jgi:hypothetical protein